jgi:hypothetical protein
MAEDSTRGRRSTTGPLLLAVIFLAVLGAGAGFSLGALAREGHNQGASGAGQTTGTTQPTDTGRPTATGDTQTTPATQPTTATTTGTATDTGNRCLKHTEDLAKAGPLTKILYLHTAQSEVWICRAGDGTLFYQGHKISAGDNLVEGSSALFLRTIQPEGGNGYVATNTDPNNGHVTRYHVTKTKLIIEYVWSGNQDVQPAV